MHKISGFYTVYRGAYGVILGLVLALALALPFQAGAKTKEASVDLMLAQDALVDAFQLSPDGRKLAWLAGSTATGAKVYWRAVQTDGSLGAVQTLALPAAAPIWRGDSEALAVAVDASGRETPQVWQQSLQAHKAQVLRDSVRQAQTPSMWQVQGPVRHSADWLLTSNARDARVFDLWRARSSGAATSLHRVAQNPGDVVQWLTDTQGQLAARIVQESGSLALQTYTQTSQKDPAWHTRFRWPATDSVRILALHPGSKQVWAVSNRGRDTQALVLLQLDNGAEQVAFSDPRVDISSVLYDPDRGRPLALTLEPGAQIVHFFDTKLQRAYAALAPQLQALVGPYRIQFLSGDEAQQRITARVQGERGGVFILWQLATQSYTVLGEDGLRRYARTQPEGKGLPRRIAVQFKARDGMPLSAYVTLPADLPDQGLPADKPRPPALLLVHGGPWARDEPYTDNPLPYYLASLGMVVMQVNFRGSLGYGKRFVQAAKGQFGLAMQHDLLDAAAWLQQQGWAAAGRIGIYGGSYGGYASLLGMTHSPGQFACAASFAGISDLGAWLQETPPWWMLGKAWWHNYVGNPALAADSAEMRKRSPLYSAQRVLGPVLLLHGANDTRVLAQQSARMAQALQAAGKNVRLRVFPHSGHGSADAATTRSVFVELGQFFQGCLSPRAR